MDATDLEPCFGKPDTDPQVAKVLKALGVTKKLKPDDESVARVKRPDLGLILVFRRVDPKSSDLTLCSIQYYSDAEKGFTTFAGALPEGLTWNDTPADVKKKLGKPDSEVKAYRMQHWKKKDVQRSIQYKKDNSGISYMTLGLRA